MRLCRAQLAKQYSQVVNLNDLQALMVQTYGSRDTQRGVASTIAWLTEELGELSQAIRKGTKEQQLHELGDVLAWLASLAAQLDLSMEDAVQRFSDGCPACHAQPCDCVDKSIKN